MKPTDQLTDKSTNGWMDKKQGEELRLFGVQTEPTNSK